MKKGEAQAHWSESVSELTDLEQRMVVLLPKLERYQLNNLLHMGRIAKGNLSSMKEILLLNQERIVTALYKPKKGGKK